MIELVTYRMSMHTTADDPKKYRSEKEVEEWEKRDPIVRFEKYLRGRNLLTDAGVEEMDEDVRNEVREAEERWLEQIGKGVDPLDMFDHAYAEMPPSLRAQKEELERELSEKKR